MKGIALNLRPKREAKRLTRRELGQRVGVSPSQLYRIEKGIRLPSIPTLCRCVDEVGAVRLIFDGKAYLFDRDAMRSMEN